MKEKRGQNMDRELLECARCSRGVMRNPFPRLRCLEGPATDPLKSASEPVRVKWRCRAFRPICSPFPSSHSAFRVSQPSPRRIDDQQLRHSFQQEVGPHASPAPLKFLAFTTELSELSDRGQYLSLSICWPRSSRLSSSIPHVSPTLGFNIDYSTTIIYAVGLVLTVHLVPYDVDR